MKTSTALQILEDVHENWGENDGLEKGLEILRKHDKGLKQEIVDDKVLASDFEKTVAKMTKREVNDMALFGWNYDEESGRWFTFTED